jgi:hypothetical protein
VSGLVGFPEGVFCEYVIPGNFRALLKGVTVTEIGRVIFVLDKVEIATWDEVHVVGDVT